MARAIWSGSIAFGLVNIPIELHTAVRQSRPKFRMLHAKDKSPVKFERVCIKDGHPVAWDDLVKGFEYQKGRFVVVVSGGVRIDPTSLTEKSALATDKQGALGSRRGAAGPRDLPLTRWWWD